MTMTIARRAPRNYRKVEAVDLAVFHDLAERELFLRGCFLVPPSILIALVDDLRRRWDMIPGGEHRDVVLLFTRSGHVYPEGRLGAAVRKGCDGQRE